MIITVDIFVASPDCFRSLLVIGQNKKTQTVSGETFLVRNGICQDEGGSASSQHQDPFTGSLPTGRNVSFIVTMGIHTRQHRKLNLFEKTHFKGHSDHAKDLTRFMKCTEGLYNDFYNRPRRGM